jgi:hypothetical protein
LSALSASENAGTAGNKAASTTRYLKWCSIDSNPDFFSTTCVKYNLR